MAPLTQPEALRERFQELAASRVVLSRCHLPDQLDQLLQLITRQRADHVSNTLHNLDRVVLIHLLVFAAVYEPQDIDQSLGQGTS
ncbi:MULTISPECIES: hypothetical protein [Streptomyces]|uniref:hypothetical protein n=1 Tax=Streptomyces TaxID=1883 RepID=UPI0016750632|nr:MULTISPECIES: hypothetical protein [Streptomyces]MBD3580510.1 hypothetical protein [Streptomyces sp. KD18]GGT30484.1 hypothetical protein GCM10010286_64540 [Streptomyces toxytricini]